METMTYTNSSWEDVSLPQSDHVAISPVYTVEVIKDAKYKYTGKIIEYEQIYRYSGTRSGKTGCGTRNEKGLVAKKTEEE